jgi:hypothetical protein
MTKLDFLFVDSQKEICGETHQVLSFIRLATAKTGSDFQFQ